MGRFLSAIAALIVLAAAVPPRATGKVPFAVRTSGLTFTEKVASLMPTRAYEHEDPDKLRLPLKTASIPFDFDDGPGW